MRNLLLIAVIAGTMAGCMAEPMPASRPHEKFHEKPVLVWVPAILFFHAPWCAACREVEPELRKMPCVVIDVNVDERPDLVREYGIDAIPTFVRGENPHKRTHDIRDVRQWLSR